MGLRYCPHCRKLGHTIVIDSRVLSDGEVCRRRYKCNCGARFSTMEIMVGEIQPPGQSRVQQPTVRRALGNLAINRIIGGSYDEI